MIFVKVDNHLLVRSVLRRGYSQYRCTKLKTLAPKFIFKKLQNDCHYFSCLGVNIQSV